MSYRILLTNNIQLSVKNWRKFDLALSDFERAFELNPASATAWAYATRGRVYMGMGDYQRAWEDLERAFKLAPDDPWVNRWRKEAWEGWEKRGQQG